VTLDVAAVTHFIVCQTPFLSMCAHCDCVLSGNSSVKTTGIREGGNREVSRIVGSSTNEEFITTVLWLMGIDKRQMLF